MFFVRWLTGESWHFYLLCQSYLSNIAYGIMRDDMSARAIDSWIPKLITLVLAPNLWRPRCKHILKNNLWVLILQLVRRKSKFMLIILERDAYCAARFFNRYTIMHSALKSNLHISTAHLILHRQSHNLHVQ